MWCRQVFLPNLRSLGFRLVIWSMTNIQAKIAILYRLRTSRGFDKFCKYVLEISVFGFGLGRAGKIWQVTRNLKPNQTPKFTCRFGNLLGTLFPGFFLPWIWGVWHKHTQIHIRVKKGNQSPLANSLHLFCFLLTAQQFHFNSKHFKIH